jgi:hypothetical protein
LIKQGRNAEAETAFREALRLKPDDEQTQKVLDDLIAKQKQAKGNPAPFVPTPDSKTPEIPQHETQKLTPES